MTFYPVSGTARNSGAAVPPFPNGSKPAPFFNGPHLQASATGLGLEGQAWIARAGELADWMFERAIVRTDCFVAYQPVWVPGSNTVRTSTVHEELTRDRLVRHFRGYASEERVAVHVVAPHDQSCKVTILDIDAHGPDDDPGANWNFARVVARRAMERGLEVLLLDSNGAGGFHVWALHRRPITCRESHLFGKWLIHDWQAHGLRKAPESMPKRPALGGKGYGSTIRLPGRHHKRDHWTRVWDRETEDREGGFLRGEAAVTAILAAGARSDLVPATPLVPPEFSLDTQRFVHGTSSRTIDPDDLDRHAVAARVALRYLGEEYFEDYDRWVSVGMALKTLGDQGLALWHEWSAQSSSSYRPEDLDYKWTTFAAPAEGESWTHGRRHWHLSLGTLFAWAREEGWVPPWQSAPSIAEEAERCRHALRERPEVLDELADRLEVDQAVLNRLGVGWRAFNRRPGEDDSWVDDGPAWTFPLVDGAGSVIGLVRRYQDDLVEDRLVKGSKPGLLVPDRWQELQGAVLLPESYGDVAFLVGRGLCAIGRPAIASGVDHLVRLLDRVDREIVVIAEDDRQIDGSWSGKERADGDAKRLAEKLQRRVRSWCPPKGCEDVRRYLKSRGIQRQEG